MAKHEAAEALSNSLEVHFWAQGIFLRQFYHDGDTRQKDSWRAATMSDSSSFLRTKNLAWRSPEYGDEKMVMKWGGGCGVEM